ncbi:unnamed protein product, partial [Nesidiocoris tenuis]
MLSILSSYGASAPEKAAKMSSSPIAGHGELNGLHAVWNRRMRKLAHCTFFPAHWLCPSIDNWRVQAWKDRRFPVRRRKFSINSAPPALSSRSSTSIASSVIYCIFGPLTSTNFTLNLSLSGLRVQAAPEASCRRWTPAGQCAAGAWELIRWKCWQNENRSIACSLRRLRKISSATCKPTPSIRVRGESVFRVPARACSYRAYGYHYPSVVSRYPNLNSRSVLPVQMRSQFNTDDPNEIEQYLKAPKNTVLNSETPKKRKRRDAVVHADTLLHWLQRQVALCDDVTIENVTSSFKDGMALCAIINRYRPHLLDFALLNREEVAKNNQIAFDILEQELAIPPEETEEGKDEAVKAQLTRIRNLAQITPQKKLSLLTKLTSRPSRRRRSHLNSGAPIQGTVEDRLSRLEELSHDNEKDFYDRHILEPSSSSFTSPYAERIRELERERRERARRREDIERNRMDRYMRRKYLRHIANQQFYKSISMLQSNARDDEEKQPIEDFSLFVYRMTAPDFKDRVKELENKLLRPVTTRSIVRASTGTNSTASSISACRERLPADEGMRSSRSFPRYPNQPPQLFNAMIT